MANPFPSYIEMPAEVLFRLGENGTLSSLGTANVRVPMTLAAAEGGKVRMTPGPIAPEIACVLENAAAEIRANYEADQAADQIEETPADAADH